MERTLLVAAAGSLALMFGLASPGQAQWIKYEKPGIPRTADGRPNLTAPAPRTSDGKPDLSGLWFGDPGGYGNDVASQLKRSEKLPWVNELLQKRAENFKVDHPRYHCMPDPGYHLAFGFFKVLQTTDTVAILAERGSYRQILADGRPLPDDPNPTWMGYSVGRWDGDTFVVESAGFNDRTWLDSTGHSHSGALRVTERFRRRDFGHLDIQITFDDPKAYTRPWTIAMVAELRPDTELIEDACNENERSLSHVVITDEDVAKVRKSTAVSSDVLARYAGAYDMATPTGRKATFTVTFDGERLLAQPPTGGAFPLVPVSETVFTVAGSTVEFFKTPEGQVTHFVVKMVEGEIKAVRQQ